MNASHSCCTQLPDDVETVYLANPSLSREDILHAIADELKVELPILHEDDALLAIN